MHDRSISLFNLLEVLVRNLFLTMSAIYEWKHVCAGISLFIYVCIIAGDPIIKRGRWMVGIPLTDL
jgi:hypothetical protein